MDTHTPDTNSHSQDPHQGIIGTPRPVVDPGGELNVPEADPLEVYVSTQQRYWVDRTSLFGITLKGGVNGTEVLGIVYDQIEDLQNALGPIYSLFLTLDCMEVRPGDRAAWCENLQMFDADAMKEDLIRRVEEICAGLDSGAISFLGLNLEKFKAVMCMMMKPGFTGGADAYSIPRGASARKVFFGTEDPAKEAHDEAFLTAEAKENNGKFYYYPDGNGSCRMDEPLEALRPQIDAIRRLPPEQFISAMFHDLLASVQDGGHPMEDSPRYQGSPVFARTVFQKLFAIHFAIRTCLEEDEPIFLQGASSVTTLRAIKQAIEEARQRRLAGIEGGMRPDA